MNWDDNRLTIIEFKNFRIRSLGQRNLKRQFSNDNLISCRVVVVRGVLSDEELDA